MPLFGAAEESSSRVWGIPNFGNSCFLNATLQLLSSSSSVLTFASHLTGEMGEPQSQKETVAKLLHLCLSQLSPPRPADASPAMLASTVSALIGLAFSKAPMTSLDQEDAQETLLWLLEVLGACAEGVAGRDGGLRMAIGWHDTGSADAFGAALRSSLACGARAKALMPPWRGVFRTERKCVVCGVVVRSAETEFVDISLPLEDRQGQTVETLIVTWLRSERVDGVQCEKCKVRTTQIRQISISKAPEVIFLHFLRQVGDGSYAGKIQSHVGIASSMHLPVNRRKILYDLKGVVVHHGGGGGGHYTAFRRDGENGAGNWVHISDSQVVGVDEEKVLASSAYQLAYERRK